MRLIDTEPICGKCQARGSYSCCLCRIGTAPTVDAVVLPCKVGGPVFIIGGKYRTGRFEAWINPGKFRLSDLEKMGKTVFLTHKEAETALAELEKAWGVDYGK